jgi:hypothetical protein
MALQMTVERQSFDADDILQLASEVAMLSGSVDEEAGERLRIAASLLRYFARGLTGPITVAQYKIRLKRPE